MSNRIVLHFDYDCFYAAVVEADNPTLKNRPLAIQQKQIVVTCNYAARERGLTKLQLISEARKQCPDVVIVLGEDLTRFRDVSRELYLCLRGMVWGDRVEKLGLDEVFVDVSDMIDYNVDLISPDLQHCFFYLDRRDPTAGFAFDATAFYGPTWPEETAADTTDIRLVLASHLAGYLRHKILEKGYAATVGISSSKLLAKLVGSVHKPNNQTTLVPSNDNITRFLDGHRIKQIPGIGSKMAEKLHAHLASDDGGNVANLTVHDIRQSPGMGPALLDRLFHGPGSSRGLGARIWGFLHGIDQSDVMEARDLPTQISIEDTYGRLDRLEAVKHELVKLASSLLRRMRTDLTTGTSWRAYPRTLRLTSRLRTPDNPYVPRSSRSAPLPSFVFNLEDRAEALAERLVQEHVLPLFRRLHPEKNGWALSLLNIAVTNMADGVDQTRDIGALFRRQTTTDPVSTSAPAWHDESDDDEDLDSASGIQCARCRATIPWFAVQAHEQYHQVPD